MHTDDLHRQLYTPDLIANALGTDPGRPLLQLLDGPLLTVGQVRDATSQFVQALASVGVGPGTRVALVSPNRPEVLHVGHAVQLLAAVNAPMHPLGSLADHQHVIEDSGIDILVFDAERYGARAAELAARVRGLRLLALGASPLGENLCALAERFVPKPLVAPRVGPHDVVRLGYSGGTTGKPKALASVHRTALATLQMMLADCEYFTLRQIIETIMSVTHTRRLILPLPPPYMRALIVLLDSFARQLDISTYWVDYVAVNRTCPVENLPRTFGLMPARFAYRLNYLERKPFVQRIQESFRFSR